MVNDFLKDIIKSTGNEYASLVEDGVEAGDCESFIDTGSYIFNALLSGSIYGGGSYHASANDGSGGYLTRLQRFDHFYRTIARYHQFFRLYIYPLSPIGRFF